MQEAHNIMRGFNPNALISAEDDYAVMVEDVTDPDGRAYRLEYRSTPDGSRALAYCLQNPWLTPQGHDTSDYFQGHVDSNGFLCLGSEVHTELHDSTHDLEFVIHRARFWCTAFSVYKETGTFPNPGDVDAEEGLG